MKINEYLSVFFECLLIVTLIYFVFLVRLNVFTNAVFLKEQAQVAVFLQPGQASPEVIAEKIRALNNFGSLEFLSKERTRTLMSEMKNDIAVAGENPFPDTFRVIPLRITVSEVENLSSEIRRIKGVEETRYDRNLAAFAGKLDASKVFIELFLKTTAAALLVLLITAIAGMRAYFTDGFMQTLDYFYFAWGAAGSAAGIALFEGLYHLILSGALLDLRAGKIILVLGCGLLFSAARTLKNAKKTPI